MHAQEETLTATPSCTAFDHTRRVAMGSYIEVAIALKEHCRNKADAPVLIFDDHSGRQIDFDLRGTDREIAERILEQFSLSPNGGTRSAGRPKLGVVSREITLMPRHWEWLAGQPGGASATLRRLVEGARRAGPDASASRRAINERTYRFMSAMAGNFPNFEEAARTLFAGNISGLKQLIVNWPDDIRDHVIRLSGE